MVSSTANALIRMGGWAYIPNFATSTALQVLYRVYTVVTGRPPPAAGTPAHVRNYRYTYAVVVLGYLAYNLVEASRLMPPNYYEILGVYPDADEGRLKAGFRAFARRYHPDKIGPEGEALFIGVRDAYEALKNPVTRFAYDRSACLHSEVHRVLTFSQVRARSSHVDQVLDSIGVPLSGSYPFRRISSRFRCCPSRSICCRCTQPCFVCGFRVLRFIIPTNHSL
jgi:hypothetical protein